MRMKKVLAVGLAAAMAVTLAGCGSEGSGDSGGSSEDLISYADLKLGEDLTDLEASLVVYNNRTDMVQDKYEGKKWSEYIADFNKEYPNIRIDLQTDTDYEGSALLRLQSEEWGDIMLIPAVDKGDLSVYFEPLGDLETLGTMVRFASDKAYEGTCYGIPTTGDAQGVVYNKKVFEEAGVSELPATPEEFLAALKAIRDKFGDEVTPLYTNYAEGWTMGAWDQYINGSSTGDAAYMNQKFLHTSNPFSDPGDGTHAYNVYKILYDAVANGYTEDDFATTDWQACKGMINSGKIGCMVLGSWAYPQMCDGGPNGEDIGYMPFPITVDGKRYATAAPNYSWAVNVNADETNKQASIIFIKWMTEKSGFAFNEGGMPIALDDENWPEVYAAFDGVEYVADEPAVEGEEDLLSELNSESELNFNNGGDSKVQAIVEHATNGDMTFDQIMDDWNQKWTAAQEANGVEITE